MQIALWIGLATVAFVLLLILFLLWQNHGLVTTWYMVQSQKLPAAFDGFRIVQVSDLHNKWFGRGQKRLLRRIAREKPEIIVVTGDLISRRRLRLPPAMAFIDRAVKLVPVYFVPGNHEPWCGAYPEIRERLLRAGVHLLEDEATWLTRDGAAGPESNESIRLLGVRDPGFYADRHIDEAAVDRVEAVLERLSEPEAYQILLSHRPELIERYAKIGVDLVFSGHAHGGQVRLPLIGGLYAPSQGVLPKYTSGVNCLGSTAMVVSRGLGNSLMPIRVFNRPEVVTVTLRKA